MSICLQDILDEVHLLYEKEVGYVWDGFKAPEQRPQIPRSTRMAITVLVDQLDKTNGRIDELWRRLDADYGDE